MAPTLNNGQLIIYRPGKITRGSVVVFRQEGEVLVKRVSGLPGDLCGYQPLRSHRAASPIYVPKGSIFVLGDNSPYSCDSREFGPVHEADVVGVVTSKL